MYGIPCIIPSLFNGCCKGIETLHKVDFCLILIGKKDGFNIDIDSLFYAMYGNPYLSIPISTKSGSGDMSRNTLRMKPTGSFLKNYPQTRTGYSLHNYISAVGLIKAFNARGYYEKKIIDKPYASKKNDGKSLEAIFDNISNTLKKKMKV